MVKMDLKWLVLGMWILPDSGSEESSIYDRASFSKSVCSVNECLIHLPLSYVMSIHIFHMDHKISVVFTLQCAQYRCVCGTHSRCAEYVHRLNVFEHWCCRSIAKIRPNDRVAKLRYSSLDT